MTVTPDLRFHYDLIPGLMMESLKRYIEYGIPTGHFLRAVLENDLNMAVARADQPNALLLATYVCWLANEAPAACWGSPQKVLNWIEEKRQERRRREDALMQPEDLDE